MEKALSPEEKIRRAEEIYLRRKIKDSNRNFARVNVLENKKDFKLLKKMIIQILMCAIIYTAFYIIKNKNYIFSKEILNKSKEILSYDINIPKLYECIKEYANSFIYKNMDLRKEYESEELEETNHPDKTEETVNSISEEKTEDLIENKETIEGIGGGNTEDVQEPEELTQMEQDAKDIINSISLIVPLTGTITSRFGPRESTNPIVCKNHTGIDIARNEGTIFVAAMDGIVEDVSSVGDLGNHVKIVNGDVATVYAHCKNIYVKQGEEIKQGQNIGEVGQTRKSNRTAFAL